MRSVIRIFAVFLLLATTGSGLRAKTATSPPASGPRFVTFQPGGFTEINQKLKVNVVFVGFERGTGPQQIDDARFRQFLPAGARTPNLLKGEWLGNSFDYNYRIVYANTAYENSFFAFLTANRHTECVVTYAQEYYNRSLRIP